MSHLITLTQTKSQSLAQKKFFSNTKISFLKFLFFGITKPKSDFCFLNLQTISHFLLSTILIISASFLHLNIFIFASTKSQSKAVFLFFEKTKYHFFSHSTSTNQKFSSFSL
ncbi:MAG: hypothetical protein LBD88_01995 [Candidatus Peribacteria bacterium]|nr:hypothetical protein [Candidatus Peribacteria bacterium]